MPRRWSIHARQNKPSFTRSRSCRTRCARRKRSHYAAEGGPRAARTGGGQDINAPALQFGAPARNAAGEETGEETTVPEREGGAGAVGVAGGFGVNSGGGLVEGGETVGEGEEGSGVMVWTCFLSRIVVQLY